MNSPTPHGWLHGRYRWTIVALLFTATTINYMDRSILGVLAPTLQYKVFHWTDQEYAWINIAFKTAYAVGMLTMGAIIDRVGTKIGYLLSIGIWSLFGMLHAAVQPAFSFVGFALARFGLGIGESGNFPAAIKTVAEWFPKKERALATGIFNAGANVGAILAPLVIPLIVLPDGTGWQYAFLVTGIFSAMWVVWWVRSYQRPEDHPRVSREEMAHILSDASEASTTERLPWRRVIPVRETWAFSVAKLTDAVWWFYLFWTGKFLFDQFGLNIRGIGIPLAIIYVLADVGSVGGGWLSSAFIKRGWTINRSRKVTMLLCALCILPVMFSTQLGTTFQVNDRFFDRVAGAAKEQTALTPEVQGYLRTLDGREFASAKEFSAAVAQVVPVEVHPQIENAVLEAGRTDDLYWIAVLLIGLAAAGHQAWSANIFTLVSDVFPKKAVASVTGFGGMVGAVAGIVVDFSLGQVLTTSGPSGYFFAFLMAGLAYVVTLGIVHLLMPKMTPLDDQLRRTQ